MKDNRILVAAVICYPVAGSLSGKEFWEALPVEKMKMSRNMLRSRS